MLEVANLIAVVGGDTTAHEIRQRARCNDCGVKGNITYRWINWANAVHEVKSQRHYTNITMIA